MATALSHFTADGDVQMVDVSSKRSTPRVAKAAARVVLGAEAFGALRAQGLKKGDALAAARLAGIMGAKHVSTLIPLCHSVPLSAVAVDFELDEAGRAVVISGEASATGPTGVEMEALTAVTVAALTIYDMCKAVSKAIRIEGIHLVSKRGGQSEAYHRQSIHMTI